MLGGRRNQAPSRLLFSATDLVDNPRDCFRRRVSKEKPQVVQVATVDEITPLYECTRRAMKAEPAQAQAGGRGAVSKEFTEGERDIRRYGMTDESDMVISVDSRDGGDRCFGRYTYAAVTQPNSDLFSP
jgi:hypothetical protein